MWNLQAPRSASDWHEIPHLVLSLLFGYRVFLFGVIGCIALSGLLIWHWDIYLNTPHLLQLLAQCTTASHCFYEYFKLSVFSTANTLGLSARNFFVYIPL
jgi:hypothetical protein